MGHGRSHGRGAVPPEPSAPRRAEGRARMRGGELPREAPAVRAPSELPSRASARQPGSPARRGRGQPSSLAPSREPTEDHRAAQDAIGTDRQLRGGDAPVRSSATPPPAREDAGATRCDQPWTASWHRSSPRMGPAELATHAVAARSSSCRAAIRAAVPWPRSTSHPAAPPQRHALARCAVPRRLRAETDRLRSLLRRDPRARPGRDARTVCAYSSSIPSGSAEKTA